MCRRFNSCQHHIRLAVFQRAFLFLLLGAAVFISAHLRAGAVSRTEDASGAAGGCPQSVESAVLRAFEDASRTPGACFWHRISLPYRRSLFFTPNASENASRTPGSLFEHGTHIPYHRWPSPVPNARHRGCRSGAWRTKKRPTTICSLRPLIFLLPLIPRSVPTWRDVLGQHTPLAACLQHMHDVSGWGTFAFCIADQEYFR